QQQQQHAADVHPDELYPPNKRYDFMDANKKVDLEHVQCPPESKILTNIIKNHPLRFSIAASSSVPWIYMAHIGIYNRAEDIIKFQDNWSSAAMANIMQDFLQMLDQKSVTGLGSTSLQIMHMMNCWLNNIHVDYAGLLWEDFTIASSSNIFDYIFKIYKDHYDDIMKNIFNSGRHKDKVGMQIPAWMISEEMKQTEHYRMYAEVFGIDVPLTQSQPTESTQGTHRTPSVPRRSVRLTSPAPVPNVNKADKMILQDTLQIEKMVEGPENVVDDSSIPRNDESNIPGTRIEPMSNKESPEVEITKDKEVEITKETPVVDITNVVIPVNVNDEDEEITDEKLQELTDTHTTSSPSSPHTKLSKMNRLLSLFKTKPTRFKCYKSFFQELRGRYGYLFAHLRARFMPRKSFDTLADNLHDVMVETLPTMVDKHIKEQVMKQVPEQFQNQVPVYVVEGLILESYMFGHILHVHPDQSQTSSVPDQQYQLYLAMKGDPQLQQQDISIWLALQMKFERNTNSAKWQKTSEYEAYVSGESSSGQVFQEEQAPSTLGNQEQDDDFDFWTDSYASDDDEIPMKQVSQDIIEEVSLTIDEAKLRKMADEMLRQRCTSGDEHQYHIDQMKNFLKSDIVWESRKEILVSPHPRKTTPLVHSRQKDSEAPTLSLINQDLLYLRKGNSEPEKIVLSLHKFPAVIFNDNDIEERTSRWVNKCVRKFNPYACYGVEHWKNPHAKIFYIRKQKEPGKPKEEVYSNLKIIQVVKTYWELGHEHKFIIEIVARRANKYLVSITEPNYQNLNKNDIEDIYLLIMNGKKVNLTAPTMTFPIIEDHEMFSIIYEPVHGIIYKNIKKGKLVMRHSEIHKFCDATLNRVLEGLKSYNNNIKYGYVQKELTKDKAEYLKLFEEEIEERLKHRRHMRRWEMFVNGRPLGP
ncbi:hypothetical protein Tco_0477745, partial [Tanacetum coccineum]